MAEPTQYVFAYKEVVEALVKRQGLHQGIWALYIKFGLKATNVGPAETELAPAAIIPVLEIGLQKAEKESNLTADAAKVNPAPRVAARKRQKSK